MGKYLLATGKDGRDNHSIIPNVFIMKKKRLLFKSNFFRRFFQPKNFSFNVPIPGEEKNIISNFVREEVILEEEFKHAKNTKSREAFLKQRDQILLDEEILIIQKSTRTTIPQFIKLHNYFRAKYRWYYKWHLFPFDNKLHWSVLGIVSTVFSFVIFTTILGSFPNRVLATNASVAGVATVINTNTNLTFDSGTYLSNVAIDNISRQMSGYAWSDDMGWVDFANTGSSPADPVVVDVNGNLSGKAKVINGGYIDFDSSPTGANVSIVIGGNFSGYAWSDDLGWINFTGVTAPSYNPAPSDPSAVSIGSIDSTLFTVSWTDNSGNETGFKVFVSTVANADCSLATYPGSPDFTTAANAVSQAVTGKSINSQYCAKVIATNADGDSSPAYSSPAYTLANQPNAATVNATSTTSLTVIINVNSNPAATEFAISCDSDSTFLNYTTNACEAIASDSNHWRTYANWGGAAGFVDTGLSTNTNHTYKVKARNGDLTNTSLSSGASKYTLTSAPAAPTLAVVSASSINITLTDNGSTGYAIAVSADGGSTWNFVKHADGTTQASADWQNYAAWGSGSGFNNVSLSPNVQYTYKVEAQNGDLTATAYSATSLNYTLANVPSAPIVNTPTISSLKVIINQNSNPSATQYAIYNLTASKYVKADGTMSDATPVWQTYTSWGGASGIVNTGLASNTSYTYEVKAENGDLVATALSAGTTVSTSLIRKYWIIIGSVSSLLILSLLFIIFRAKLKKRSSIS